MKIIPFLLLASFIVFTGCESENLGDGEEMSTDLVTNPITAADGGSEDLNVIMAFENNKYEFGKIIQGEKVSHSFLFTNDGDAPLIISSVSASCGCTVPSWPKDPIPPGQQGQINVVFNSEGKSGVQAKDITVISNAIPNTSVLRISGEVIVP